MERISGRRAGWILGLFALVIALYGLTLYNAQVAQNSAAADNTKTFTTYTIVKAARGELLDASGKVLVTNRACYDLVFNHYVICSANNRNAILLELVQLCRDLDVEYEDHLPVSDDAPFTYTLNDYSSTWQSYFQSYLSIKPRQDSDISAPLLMKKLREYYNIPASWSDRDARAVIGIRYELDLRQGVTNLSNYVFITDVSSHALPDILELSVPGLNAEASVARVYNTKYAAHILGYLGAMDPEQWAYYKTLTYEYEKPDGTVAERQLYSMDALVGQDGFEEAFEEYLHGVDGIRVDVTYVDGTIKESYYTVEPKAGQNVMLTIDIDIQETAEKNLASLIEELRAEGGDKASAQGGAAVVINVKTGEVLACASYPTYDLATFRENYNELLQTPYSPLFNRALLATYAPGSTYKVSMLISAMENGIITAEDEVYDSGVYMEYAAQGFTPHCLIYTNYGWAHGWINAKTALQYSCNYYFYYLADHMKIEMMDRTAQMLGLGEKTGVELFEEQGQRANPETKAELYTGSDSHWYIADQILASIGQSENRFTPIQLCSYAATLANRGVRYKATFLNRVVSADYSDVIVQNTAQVIDRYPISDATYQAYSEGMRMVALGGTAFEYFYDYPIPVACKTGTAETDDDSSGSAAFICYAPFDDPEIAVAVYVEKGGWGSTSAPVARAILDEYFYDVLHGDSDMGENQIG